MDDPAFRSARELAGALAASKISAVDLAAALLDRVHRLDPTLKAFVRLTPDRALAEAHASDTRRRNGTLLGPLDGIPFAVKDIIDVAGLPTMAGTSFLEGPAPQVDAHAVDRLSRAGMVLIGKTHTVQFAFHIVGINHDVGTPHNPWHKVPHVPGGSSSGSAVAVAAGLVPVALGSDTGGSIRVPATLSGTVGFKPTGGRLGRGGVRPLAWSLDTIGPLTRSVEDAALVFDGLQGPDPRDEITAHIAPIDGVGALDEGIDGLTVGICETVFFDECAPDVAAAVEEAALVLERAGANVRRLTVPAIAEARVATADGTLIAAEAYAENASFFENRPARLDPLGDWIGTGRDITAASYYRSLRERERLKRRLIEDLSGIDALIAPTSAVAAWTVARLEAGETPPGRYSRNTSIGNMLDLPSLSLPCGFTQTGLPIGAMIMAKPFDDRIVLRLAHALQERTEWHRRQPDLGWIEPR